MTSHREPPIPLVGSYQPASYEGGVSPLSSLLPRTHHSLSLTHPLEPDPKKRKTEDNTRESQTGHTNAAAPVLLGEKSMPAWKSSADESRPAAKHSTTSTSKGPSLLPDRRLNKQLTRKRKRRSTNLAIERAAMRHEVQTRAYVAEPPNLAPRYQKTRPSLADGLRRTAHLSPESEAADFFPWLGHHPEDMLNELTTRNGFYDKLAASQNESLTAKPSVLSSLKNKSGLQILSSHFSSALNLRERHGTITATSTFKPPPRVTLTDTKREAWLRDLADSEVPLRRLSRTIPHGIIGTALLDHCLSKDIPVSRAIWLVKCVGANEIRAGKRKATSGNFTVEGEIRKWTTYVEQFLEAIVDKCGSKNWRSSMNYSLRLVSAIYAEYLLDRKQYYEWLIKHLANDDLDRISIWLLPINIHWDDLLRCREYGIFLANAILKQLDHARKPVNRLPYDALFQELQQACQTLLVRSPDCFLLPRCWSANKQILQEFVVSGDDFLQRRLNDITLRIERLENHVYMQLATPSLSSEQIIISALDNLVNEANYPKIANTCWMAARSKDDLFRSCLQWATSTFRFGRYRIYAAVRLLRLWNKHSIDLQKPLLEFLALGKQMPNTDWADFHSLCAELVSSRHFSVGRYCQWLLARGALAKHHGSNDNHPFEVQLLFELPLHNLPDHIRNLRRSILSSIGFSTEQEDALISAAQAEITQQLPAIFLENRPSRSILADPVPLNALSRMQKSAIARWAQRSLSSYVETQKHQGHDPTREPYSRVTEPEFRIIRQIFEDLEEYFFFSDILCSFIVTTRDGALIATITATVNYHFDILNSLGTAKHMFDLLFSHRNLPSSQEATQSSFTLALLDLGVRLPDSGPAVRSLRKDEALLNAKQSAAAPSPISDNMLENVHSDKTSFLEEMDQMLANVTAMDHATRARCFAAITYHLEKSWRETTPFSYQYPGLLARLRAFDERSFDDLAFAWLETLVTSSTRPALTLILTPLVCHDICSLSSVLDCATQYIQKVPQEKGIFVVLETLELLSGKEIEDTLPIGCKGYRLLQQRTSILQTHFEPLVFLVHSCVKAARADDSLISSQAASALESGPVKSFTRLLVSQFSIADKPAVHYSALVQSGLKDILSREWALGLGGSTVRENFSQLLDSVSDLNRNFSHMSLRTIIETTRETEQDIPDILAEVLLEKLMVAPQSRVILWSHLLSSLDANSAVPIHGWIVRAIMSEASKDYTVSSSHDESKTESLLYIAMATFSDAPASAILPLIEQILERLSKLASFLPIDNNKDDPKPEIGKLLRKTSLLLHVLTTHQAVILRPKFSQPHLAQICLSLATLYLQATNSSCTSIADHAFDVLAIMSDGLAQETRSRIIRVLSNAQDLQDSRVHFIFGEDESSAGGERLRLVSSVGSAQETAKRHLYSLRHWEMMQDATPVVTENDTCLSLTLFAAKTSTV